MKLVVHGEDRGIEDGATIAELLQSKDLRPEMVVVEHNGEIVSRGRYGEIHLAPGDNLEVVQMMAGG
jgi:sulfur carrier protein